MSPPATPEFVMQSHLQLLVPYAPKSMKFPVTYWLPVMIFGRRSSVGTGLTQ